MTSRRLSAGLLLLACPVWLGACGGAAEKAPASPSTGSPPPAEVTAPEPRTVREAQDQIAHAAREIADPERLPSARSEEPRPTTAEPTREDEATKKAWCAMPCQAIRSMRRAVDALCRMTGHGDPACADAKKTLTENEARVAPCGC